MRFLSITLLTFVRVLQARKQDRKLSPRGDVLRKLVQEKSYKDAKFAMGGDLVEAGLQLRGQGTSF